MLNHILKWLGFKKPSGIECKPDVSLSPPVTGGGTMAALPPLELWIGEDFTCDSFSRSGHEYEYDKETGKFLRTSFLYDELDDDAKEKAREWYCSNDYPYYDWWDSVYDWFQHCEPDEFVRKACPYFEPGEIEGFELYRGGGVALTGRFNVPEAVAYILTLGCFSRNVLPRYWKRLHAWLEYGTVEVRDHAKIGCAHSYHSGSTYLSCDWGWNEDRQPPAWVQDAFDELNAMFESDTNDIEREVLRALTGAYEGMFEEEYVAENICCNDYTFTKEGEPV